MSLKFDEICIDAHNATALGSWWSNVLPIAEAVPLTIGPAATDTVGGWLPDGQTLSPSDESHPILEWLDPALLKAIQDATRKAAAEGIDIQITSGWRSKGFQQRLFDDAVRTYGSVTEVWTSPGSSLRRPTCRSMSRARPWTSRRSRPTSGLFATVRDSVCARSTRTRYGTSSWPSTSKDAARC